MSNPRLSIATLKQLIQYQSSALTNREIARALQVSPGAVSKYRRAVQAARISAEEAQHLDDTGVGKASLASPGCPATASRGAAGLCVDPHADEAPQARDVAAGVGGVPRSAWRVELAL